MKVCVLGSNGFLGKNILDGTAWTGLSRKDLNLIDQKAVRDYFSRNEYDVVVHCAAVGGSRNRPDDSDVMYQNIIMFENVVCAFKGKIIYFSSGASLRGNPPVDPYGLSKWIIDKRIENISNVYSLRIWGCYGPHELSSRFSYICKVNKHVVIDKDRYFDFIDVSDVCDIVGDYIIGKRVEKFCNLVYQEKLLLSQWAKRFGATHEIKDTSSLGEPYHA